VSFRSQKDPENCQETVNFSGARPFAAREQPYKPISMMIYENFPISVRHSWGLIHPGAGIIRIPMMGKRGFTLFLQRRGFV
jgi:hypothetical protein